MDSQLTWIASTSIVLLMVFTSDVQAETWTTPDGFLSVTAPDGSGFQTLDVPPSPFLKLWVSNDDTVKLGVMRTQIPPSVELIQSSAEEGLAE